jgi:hypothetical protein
MRLLIPLFLLVTGAHCQKSVQQPDLFTTSPAESPISSHIREASGITPSFANKNHLWVQEDSGNPPKLFLLKNDGNLADSVYLDGATNYDWEDISRFSNEGKNFIVIGDIGDNGKIRSHCSLYILEEPSLSKDTINSFQEIIFNYSDGPHDAEGFIIEPSTLNLFIFSKEADGSTVYQLDYPYQGKSAVPVHRLNQNMITSAALSDDGKELLLKSYFNINYYSNKNGSVLEILKSKPVQLPYSPEPQGEAICFGEGGFYTLSEGNAVKLRFYKR